MSLGEAMQLGPSTAEREELMQVALGSKQADLVIAHPTLLNGNYSA